MSSRRFLVGLRDITSSEKIAKIKSLLKEDLDKVDNTYDDEITNRLLSNTGIAFCSPEHLSLSDGSREVAVQTAGYIAKKLKSDSKTVVRNICLEIWFLKIQISLIFKSCREED